MERREKRYKYPLWGILSSIVPSSIAILIGLALLLRWVGTIFTVLSDLVGGYPPASGDLQFLATAWMPFVIGGTLLTLYTEVIVTDDGMKVRVFIFKWVFIPWEDVLGVTVPPIPGGNDPSLWRFIRVRKLTLFHRLSSICYCTGIKPVLIVNKHIEGYEELIRTIEEHVEQRRSASRGEEG